MSYVLFNDNQQGVVTKERCTNQLSSISASFLQFLGDTMTRETVSNFIQGEIMLIAIISPLSVMCG